MKQSSLNYRDNYKKLIQKKTNSKCKKYNQQNKLNKFRRNILINLPGKIAICNYW